MREIRTSGLMSGEGKRGHWLCLNATAPFLDSTVDESEVGATLPRRKRRHGMRFVVQRLFVVDADVLGGGEAVMLGDQLVTDVLALGAPVFLAPPVGERALRNGSPAPAEVEEGREVGVPYAVDPGPARRSLAH